MGNPESSAAPAATARCADLIAAVGQLRDIDYIASATTLHLDRDRLAPLLARGAAVSGLEVARLLWPDHEVVRSRSKTSGLRRDACGTDSTG